MNFNYDLITWIEYFIGAFICCLGVFFIGKILFITEHIKIKWYSYLILIALSILTIFNTLIFDNVFKVFLTFVIFFLIYKLIFYKNIINSCLYAIFSCICFMFAEAIDLSIIALLEIFFKNIVLSSFTKSIFINVMISCTAVIFSCILRKKINGIINKINNNSIFYIIVLGIISVIVMATSLFKLANNDWKVDYAFILNIFTFLGFLILTFVLLKQYLVNREITDKYVLLNDYLKTSAELIEKYSTTVHKYKNNLIAIKGYLKTNSHEAENYIDNLLGEYNNKKYSWVKKINYIQIDAIRYLIYYKLSKAENENLKIMINVSEDMKKIPNNIINIKESNILLEIIGEYFDNAIYASSESKLKELNFMMYEENENVMFIISNTYKEKFDLSLITKNGYTTKGKGHGLGLYDIDRVARKNSWIKIKYELLDNYFIATLALDIKKVDK